MSLPFSVSKVGPLLATIYFIIIAIVMVICTYLLIEIADNSWFKGNKYETIGELVWSKKGKYLIDIMLHTTIVFSYVSIISFVIDYFND